MQCIIPALIEPAANSTAGITDAGCIIVCKPYFNLIFKVTTSDCSALLRL